MVLYTLSRMELIQVGAQMVASAKKTSLDPLDCAMAILQKKAAPIPVRELLEAVADQLKIKANPERARFMAELHTALSLDNRVVAAVGQWAMKEWVPKPKARTASIKAPAGVVRKKKAAAVAVVEPLLDEEEDLAEEEAEVPLEDDASEDEDEEEREWD